MSLLWMAISGAFTCLIDVFTLEVYSHQLGRFIHDQGLVHNVSDLVGDGSSEAVNRVGPESALVGIEVDRL